MQGFYRSSYEMLARPWQHRDLIITMTKREIIAKYRGSIIGVFWYFLNPLVLLLIYTFVFTEILQAKWGTQGQSKTEFAIILFAGLMIYNFFAETITSSQFSIIHNPNYVKKVLFPLEILPIVSLLSALFNMLMSLTMWLLTYCIVIGYPSYIVVLLPIIILPLCILALGLSWIIAAMGVFLRDLSHVVGLVITALLFISPVFYSISVFPDKYKWLMYLNPLTFAIESTRNILIWDIMPAFTSLAIFWIFACITASLGYFIFQKIRKGFADVL